MKYFYSFLFLLLIACSQKTQIATPAKPDWLQAKPFPNGYYTGIGHCAKDGTNNYIQIAKKSALDDLVSEIKVTVSSTSVLNQIDIDKKFHETFEQIIQTEAQDEIEDFELVDAWEDTYNYWVYYRLSKARYKEIKEEKKRNAALLATDYYEKGNSSREKGDLVQAASYYFQALRSMEKYLGDAIIVMVNGKDILLTNELYASLQSILNNVVLNVTPRDIQLNRRLNQNEQLVQAKATYKDTKKVAINWPLQASFLKGEGEVFPTYKTDNNGTSKILLTKIGSRELEQTVKVNVDILSLAGVGESPIFSFITSSLNVPSDQVILRVQRPLVYISSEEKSFGSKNPSTQISNKLKNLLSTSGFEFTGEQNRADLWVDVRSNSEQGPVSGSIFITYLTGVIRVAAVREGKEIYSTTLDRIKGYGLDYERSSVDAYNKGIEILEKDRLKELLDTILQ